MAQIIPFQGIRYNPAKVNIADVITKPYDKISPLEQDAYYESSPYNIVRIILGRTNKSDTDSDNQYTRAADYLNRWRAEQVLITENTPALYVYDQTFEFEGYPKKTRRALVALGKLEEYNTGIVYPHENTLKGPKKDRLALSKATNGQFGQLFMLYDDPESVINNALEKALSDSPLYQYTDPMGVVHSFYAVTDTAVHKIICDTMQDKKLLIADGHHRYETALNYARQKHDISGDNTLAPYDYHLMSFVNIHDDGLLILPTHRIVKNIQADIIDTWLKKADSLFEIKKVSTAELVRIATSPADTITIGAYTPQGAYELVLKDSDNTRKQMEQGKPDAWNELAVNVLHDLILNNIFGIDREKLALQSNLTYVRYVPEGKTLVDDGSHQVAFFVPATPIDKVMDISFSRVTMPQKSTDFYPKLFTGFVINSVQ